MAATATCTRAIVIVLLAFCTSAAARAATIETLLMPGPVVEGHAEIEGQCATCHDTKNPQRETELCLDCHEAIAADIREKSRFHGKMKAAESGQCRGCHTEHRGREADIVRLNEASFNHELTAFSLKGAHATVACQSCHRGGAAHRDAPSACIECHRKDDTHRGGLGTECDSCHSEQTWMDVTFDHDETDYPLRNRHQEVPCAACHAGERYDGTPQRCVSCHAPDDAHDGSRGTECADCHTTVGWDTAKFDHDRETDFPLLGRHARLACADCHRTGDLEAPLPRDCIGCHKSDDRHAGRFGTDCGDCHGNDTWRVTDFDHATRFDFALEGAHATIDCHACHTAVAEAQELGTECASCHRADDVHGGELGAECDQCHNSTRWSDDIRFDHDLTDFPLLGLHVVATCAQCHQTQGYSDAPSDCNGCHAKDDVHDGGLGDDCAICHSPNGWNMWDFDHAARTRFPLTGAHEQIICADCHLRPQNEVKPSMVCGSCHAVDDVHAGRFGQECQRCHTTLSFKGARPN